MQDDHVAREVDRVLNHLRAKIREHGHTQLSVQRELGWGRSYISQLVTKQKALRVEQVLAILDVIGVPAAQFYAELYRYPESLAGGWRETAAAELVDGGARVYGEADAPRRLRELRSLVRGVVRLLVDRGLLTLDELTAAVEAEEREGGELLPAWAEDAGG